MEYFCFEMIRGFVVDFFCLEDLYFYICARELVISETALRLRQVILNFLSNSFPVLGLAS